jgi:hypothetical protein
MSLEAHVDPKGEHVLLLVRRPAVSLGRNQRDLIPHSLHLINVRGEQARMLGDGGWAGGLGWYSLAFFSPNGETLIYQVGEGRTPSERTYVLHIPSNTVSGPFTVRVEDLNATGTEARLADGTLLNTTNGISRPGPPGLDGRFSADGSRILVQRDGDWYTVALESGAERFVGNGWARWALGADRTGSPQLGCIYRGLGFCGGI